jgi:hypothetical protein
MEATPYQEIVDKVEEDIEDFMRRWWKKDNNADYYSTLPKPIEKYVEEIYYAYTPTDKNELIAILASNPSLGHFVLTSEDLKGPNPNEWTVFQAIACSLNTELREIAWWYADRFLDELMEELVEGLEND